MGEKSLKRPNIVFILSDDQGAWAMGCAGNREVKTPNLDRLAASGVRFDNFFCTSPVCSPARASLLTGRIPSQHGVHDWIREGSIGPNAIEYLAGQPAYTEVLAENGYVCGLSGKWHLGDSVKPQKGFTHWFVHQAGGSPYYNAPMIKDGQLYNEPAYVTDVITDDALQFLDWQAEDGERRPFYLSVHYTAPHSPWLNGNHPQEFLDMYADCPGESCPLDTPRHPWLIKNAPGEDQPLESLRGYYASITAMDANIGRILDKLEELGLTDDTLVVFMGDNGFNFGHHGVFGKGNGTFPQNMYDTSVKVPAIFSHPARIPQGVVSDTMASGYDFMPTILEYAGVQDVALDGLPGHSFLPQLLGEPSAERENVVIYDEYGPVRMIRNKEWKYVHRYPYGSHELYHLANDPDEAMNLIDAQEYSEMREAMKSQLEQWFLQYVNPAVDGVREPVSGSGQLAEAGVWGKGKKAYQGLE
ncbi:sulfatase-like hydrolase/transferase [Paenibacillus sp. LMG 31460]|uniref:Sulfatase-like hydrolase/transferase n=1 Tax=Paenibacillus germinis TaxID=2654979 RepID=A0ABX1Z0R3_9BACL|nr:sulfatase-like hydrolase/transferase [Paenibacillus germinis]NOU86004.1 sulfatase-like hydrolase/transferase [Paenibacillus germinis]